jgi:hypothetical protein
VIHNLLAIRINGIDLDDGILLCPVCCGHSTEELWPPVLSDERFWHGHVANIKP